MEVEWIGGSDRVKILGRWMAAAIMITGFVLAAVTGAVAGQRLEFTILYTGDEHAALIPHSPVTDEACGGFARLAGAINGLREELPEQVVVVSAGDFTAGTVFSWLTLAGETPELKLLMEIGYDVITLGNHEFDLGPDALADYLLAAGSRDCGPALVAGNLIIPPGHRLALAGITDSTVVVLENGLTVGFFGLMGKGAIRVMAEHAPLTFSDQHGTAAHLVAALRAQGADVVIAVTHSGLSDDRALARAVPGIDVIIGGHCHTSLAEPVIEDGTVIVHAGTGTEYLGVLQLAFDRDDRRVVVRNEETAQPFLLQLDSSVVADPGIGRLVDAYTAQADELLSRLTDGQHSGILAPAARVGFVIPGRRLAESALGNLVSDALYYAATSAGIPVDFAVQANGQLRADLIPGREGLVTVYDVINLVGLGVGPDGEPGYPLVHVYLTGDEIRRALEISVLLSNLLGDSYYLQFSGLEFDYDPERAILLWVPVKNLPLPTYKSVVRAQTADGTKLNWGDDRLYAVISCMYVADSVPQVGELLPRLGIVPKDELGRPVQDIRDRILYKDGQEIKVWQAVLSYIAAIDHDAGGLPVIDERYGAVAGRQKVVRTVPLILWYAGGAALLLAVVATGLVLLRNRRIRRVLAEK